MTQTSSIPVLLFQGGHRYLQSLLVLLHDADVFMDSCDVVTYVDVRVSEVRDESFKGLPSRWVSVYVCHDGHVGTMERDGTCEQGRRECEREKQQYGSTETAVFEA